MVPNLEGCNVIRCDYLIRRGQMVKCSKGEVRKLKKTLHWKKLPEKQRQRVQMVLLREQGLAQPAIAAAMGVSLSTVNRAHMAYDQRGIKALKPQPCGGRQRQNMTIAQEKKLLARFAKAAGAGELLNIHDLKLAYEQEIGHQASNSTVYELLERHGWRKLMPRPFHPQRDVAAQNAFKKKGFPDAVSKARRVAARRGCRLRVMFADEARFGRMNRPRPCWAPTGTRPEVASQLIREYVYLYGAVSPKDGTCVFLVMPAPDTACFQIFLDTLAKKYPSELILLVVDGAGNHVSDKLEIPANIILQRLPPYAPELNPQENLWDEIREKIFKNYALKSMNEVNAKLDEAVLYIKRNPKVVKSITSFPYIATSF
jgi:transposase